MKNEKDFINFYNEEYKNIVDSYYPEVITKINRKKNSLLISEISSFIVVVLVMVYTKMFYFSPLLSILLVSVLLILLSCVYFILEKKIKIKVSADINENIYLDLLSYIIGNKTFEYYPDKQLSKRYFSKLELFNLDTIRYKGANYTKSIYLNKQVVFSDVILYVIDTVEKQKTIYRNGKSYIRTIRKRVRKNIFDGLYFDVKLNKKNNIFVYLIPNNFSDRFIKSSIDKYISYSGKRIKLENLDFNKKYAVYSLEENQTRYILSLAFMEKINKLDEIFNYNKYIVFKPDGNVGIFIDGLTIGSLKKRIIRFKDNTISFDYLFEIFNAVNNIYKIINILELDDDLYIKNL